MSITYTQEDLNNDELWKTIRLAKNAELQESTSRPPLTFEVKIIWDNTHHQDGSELSAADLAATQRARDVKARELWLQDKMAANLVFIENATTIYRYFYSLEGQDEWLAFITAQAESYSMNAPVTDFGGLTDDQMSTRLAQAVSARDTRAVAPGDISHASGGEL